MIDELQHFITLSSVFLLQHLVVIC